MYRNSNKLWGHVVGKVCDAKWFEGRSRRLGSASSCQRRNGNEPQHGEMCSLKRAEVLFDATAIFQIGVSWRQVHYGCHMLLLYRHSAARATMNGSSVLVIRLGMIELCVYAWRDRAQTTFCCVHIRHRPSQII